MKLMNYSILKGDDLYMIFSTKKKGLLTFLQKKNFNMFNKVKISP